jgi:hypothetical protein
MTPAQVTGVIATQRRPRPRMRATCTRTRTPQEAHDEYLNRQLAA